MTTTTLPTATPDQPVLDGEDLPEVPVIGVDPGARWTALVLRVGRRPLYGSTLGPLNRVGAPDPAALDNPSDLAAVAQYHRSIADELDRVVNRVEREFGRLPWIAVEHNVPPVSWRSVKLPHWLNTYTVCTSLLTLYPGAVLVPMAKHGTGPLLTYPEALRPRMRPATWGPNHARRGERDHERAAYDIAGAAAQLLHKAGRFQ